MTKLLIVVVLAACCVAQARHMHPRHVINMEEATEEPILKEIDGIPIEVIRNMKPSRFVPVNNEVFFTNCEEGFERDLLGICREVWK